VLRSLIALQPLDVPVRVALRNTLAIVAPLAIGIALGHASAGLAVATGALNTMFTDQPGPYRLRMQRMLMAAAAAGVAALAGILVGAHAPWFVAAALVFAFAGGLLVALGPMAARVGVTSTIVMLITAEMHLPAGNAPGVALLIFAGGALQALLAIAAWPLQRYRPERFALADVLQQLAATAHARPDAAQLPAVSQAALEALVLLHGEHRSRGVAMQSFRIIAEVCERARIDLLALSDLHARLGDPAARGRIAMLLEQAASVFEGLAAAMRSTQLPIGIEQAVSGFGALVKMLPPGDATALPVRDARLLRIAQARAESLAGQLRSLLRNARTASSLGETDAQRVEARLPAALQVGAALPTLRANLETGSVAFRHALRCAACVALAAAGERWLRIPHGVWIPMTAAIVLKPDFGGTLRFGVLRVAGTFAGLLLTTALAHYAMGNEALRLLLLAALCIGFRLLVQVNYGLGVAMLTGMVVVLLSFEGMAPADAIHARVIATMAGSTLALAAYALWPTWEGRRMQAALAALVDAYRLHLDAVLGGRLGDLVETRSAARRARSNAQASLERLRGEPLRRRSAHELKQAEALLANASRLVRASVAVEALLRDGATLPQRDELMAFATRADQALAAIVIAMREARPVSVPSLRPDERRLSQALAAGAERDDAVALAVADACDRIADSIDTLAHLLRPPPATATKAPGAPATAAG
jgi:uncharacterized membrane protein YccC